MAEGQTHVHRIKFTPNKVLNHELDITSTANIKGLTVYQMIISHGTILILMLLQHVMVNWITLSRNNTDINGIQLIQLQCLVLTIFLSLPDNIQWV